MARPLGVSVLGGLVILAAIVAFLVALAGFIVGFASLIPGVNLDTGAAFVGALLYLIVAVVLGVAGGGLLRMRPWAWWLALLASLVALAIAAYRIVDAPANVSLGTLLAIVVSAVVFVYLLTVFRYFRGARPQPA